MSASAVEVLSEPLETVRRRDGRRELERDFVIRVRSEVFVVPAGFDTDFSSVPQAFAWFVDWRRVDIAGVVHDWLYRTRLTPRSVADRVWREVAQAGEPAANWFQAWCGWLALRIGGWHAWKTTPRWLTNVSAGIGSRNGLL